MSVRRTLRRARARRSAGDRGAALTELVLIVPIFAMIVCGVLEFGMAWRDSMTVSNALRSGARVGSNMGDDRYADYDVLKAIESAMREIPDTARVQRLVYGCPNPNAGAVQSLFTIVDDPRLNHRVEAVGGVLEPECAGLLRDFFARMRKDAQQGVATAAQRHARYVQK